MQDISNRSLISRLYSSAEQQLEETNYDKENWSQWYQAIQELIVPEKMTYLIVKLNQTVTNGGFSEFYKNSFGIFTPEVIYVLNEIKATATAEIVSNTLPIVNPIGLLDDNYKEFVFNLQLSKKQKEQLYTSDVGYDQLEGHENLEDLLGAYLQEIVK